MRDIVQIHLIPIANATVSNAPINRVGASGWISTVVVNAHQIPSALIPGRVYAQVRLLNSTGRVLAALWAGYVVEGSHPVSVPGLRVYEGDQISFRCWGDVAAGSVTGGIDCMVAIDSEPCTAGSIFGQVPGDGAGDVIAIIVGLPAGGADPNGVTVPNFEYREWIGFGATLTTGAAVASRKPRCTVTDGTQEVAGTDAGVAQLASTAVQYTAAKGGGSPPNTTAAAEVNLAFPAPQGRFPPGFVCRVITARIDAGDLWTGISGGIAYLFACWAAPE
jgi:hypothetical protein